MKLTPKQTLRLVNVYQNWGKLSHCAGYLGRHELTRMPTIKELDEYWTAQIAELRLTAELLQFALSGQNWSEVERLAKHANALRSEIQQTNRDDGLYALSEAAIELAQRTIKRGEALQAKAVPCA